MAPPEEPVGLSQLTLAGCFYLLIIRHLGKTLFLLATFIVLSVLAACWVIYHFRPEMEITQPGTITFRPTFGPAQHVLLVHPFGWQPTNVEVKKDKEFKVTAAGRVSVGYPEYLLELLKWRGGDNCFVLRANRVTIVPSCLGDVRGKPPFDPRWPWVGFEGLGRQLYNEPRYLSSQFDNYLKPAPDGMLVSGFTHGTLVGCIRPRNQELKYDKIVDPSEAYRLVSDSGSGSVKPLSDGLLWVAVDDSAMYLDDNQGFYIVTITAP